MSKKILLIDDEPDLISMIKVRLEANNYNVVTAQNGLEGLEKWKEESPDLIVLDVMMPGMDGYTFVQESKSREDLKSVPLIMLTAKDNLKDIFEIEGVKDYITKPFDPEDLLAKIQAQIS